MSHDITHLVLFIFVALLWWGVAGLLKVSKSLVSRQHLHAAELHQQRFTNKLLINKIERLEEANRLQRVAEGKEW